jgi:tetratricopeptide (TPR) repeat protein
LHAFSDYLRFYSLLDPLPPRSRLFVDGSQNLWNERHMLLRRQGGVILEESWEQALRTDLLDLALLSTDLRARLAPPEQVPAVHQMALLVLTEAEGHFGSSGALCRHRWAHVQALGDADEARRLEQRALEQPPTSSWEHYALGRFWLLRGDLAAAAPELERAVVLDSLGFAPHFYLGVCYYRRGDYPQAIAEFTFCAGRMPRSECYVHRAQAHTAAGQLEQAVKDDDLALQLDPTSGVVALHRGTLQLRRRQLDEALTDMQFALDHGAPPIDVHYQLAQVHLARNEPDAARASVQQVLKHNPQHGEALKLQKQLDAPR